MADPNCDPLSHTTTITMQLLLLVYYYYYYNCSSVDTPQVNVTHLSTSLLLLQLL